MVMTTYLDLDEHFVHTVLDGRYRLVRFLGKGGMARVYEAEHEFLGTRVAVKLLHHHLSMSPEHRQRFLREARSASMLQHENLVKVTDYGETPEGLTYLVMEYLQGQDLSQLLARVGPLAWPRARGILIQAAQALGAAHRYGVIHRDIKPANCFITPSLHRGTPDQVKLLDFGIAKLRDSCGSQPGLTASGEILGTAAYLAPEVIQGKPATTKSDIYAFGIMAYECLAGSPPFLGGTSIKILQDHVYEPPPPLRSAAPTVSREVEHLILRAIAKDPDERYDSIIDVEEALRNASPLRMGRPGVPAPRRRPSSSAMTASMTKPVARREHGCFEPSPGGPSPLDEHT